MKGCFSHGDIMAVQFPASVQKIAESAFRCCDRMGRVCFEEGSELREIGKGAFAGCMHIKEAKFTNSR